MLIVSLTPRHNMHYILAISKGNKHFTDAINEYTKRIGHMVSPVMLSPFKHKNRNICIRKDSERIRTELSKPKYKNHTIRYLAINGRSHTSQEMKNIVTQPHVFVIGGPYGRDNSIIHYQKHETFSLSSLTLPHALAQLVLREQLYRGYCIYQGKTYHY